MLLADAICKGYPALVSDAALPEAVRERWSSLEYLRVAHPEVPVEVSLAVDGKLQGTVDEHESTSMAFGRTFLGQIDEACDGQWLPRPSKLQLHLAQCPLRTLPCLERDAPPPPCLPTHPERSNLWFAVGVLVSQLHYDCYHNLLQVVRGHKRVLCFPPWCTRSLLPRPAHGPSSNHSQLTDAEVLAACPTEAILFDVTAGESLFIPEGWWHRVESSDHVTVALNHWWTPVIPQRCDGRMAAYTLRRSFDDLVRAEQRRLCGLPESTEQPRAKSSKVILAESSEVASAKSFKMVSAGDDGSAFGVEPPCPACGRCASVPGGVNGFFAAAAGGESQLLAWLASCEAQQVAWCLSQCAAVAPSRLYPTFRESFSPRTAFALGERLDDSLHANCGACARQAQGWVDAAFGAAGEEARLHLRSLTDILLKAAAENVLIHTLGLSGGSAGESTISNTS
jgi:ferredoxin